MVTSTRFADAMKRGIRTPNCTSSAARMRLCNGTCRVQRADAGVPQEALGLTRPEAMPQRPRRSLGRGGVPRGLVDRSFSAGREGARKAAIYRLSLRPRVSHQCATRCAVRAGIGATTS
jgi:hypothetical protein